MGKSGTQVIEEDGIHDVLIKKLLGLEKLTEYHGAPYGSLKDDIDTALYCANVGSNSDNIVINISKCPDASYRINIYAKK